MNLVDSYGKPITLGCKISWVFDRSSMEPQKVEGVVRKITGTIGKSKQGKPVNYWRITTEGVFVEEGRLKRRRQYYINQGKEIPDSSYYEKPSKHYASFRSTEWSDKTYFGTLEVLE